MPPLMAKPLCVQFLLFLFFFGAGVGFSAVFASSFFSSGSGLAASTGLASSFASSGLGASVGTVSTGLSAADGSDNSTHLRLIDSK